MTKVLKFNYVSIIFPAVSKSKVTKKKAEKTFNFAMNAVYGMLSWDMGPT